MANSINNKTTIKVTIGVLTIFAGLCLILSNYFQQKKFEVFDEMNDLYYGQLVELEESLEELSSDPVVVEDILEEIETPVVEEVQTEEPVVNEPVPTTTKPVAPPIDYNKYYVGHLSIPKINLRKGFTEIDNRYNTVSRNIQVIKPSDYPDVVNGNFIIAAHSGSSSVSFFKDLHQLSLNDTVNITYNNREYKYVIKNIYTDSKTGNVTIRRNKNKTTLTLITCTKGDRNTQTIYIAERIG